MKRKEAEMRSYSTVFKEDQMKSNKQLLEERAGMDINAIEEDFM